MTCDRCMDVIDAGPFVSHSREQLEAAQAHIQRCDRCATALGRTESLTTRLESMPSPGPSRDLTQNVMARIAVLETSVPQLGTVRDQAVPVAARQGSRWALASGALAAVAATLLVTASVMTSSESFMPSVAGFRMGLFAMPGSPQELLTGVVSAVLYASGLFVSDRFTYRQRTLPRRHGGTESPTRSS